MKPLQGVSETAAQYCKNISIFMTKVKDEWSQQEDEANEIAGRSIVFGRCSRQ